MANTCPKVITKKSVDNSFPRDQVKPGRGETTYYAKTSPSFLNTKGSFVLKSGGIARDTTVLWSGLLAA